MATAREIRRRIRSVKNIAKITKAMQLVAAARMRRAQSRVTEARPYADALRQVLSGLATQAGRVRHPLLAERPVVNVLIIEVTPDRGLAGSLISNIHRRVGREIVERGANTSMVAVGRKARDFARRTSTQLIAEFTGISDTPVVADVAPISRLVIDAFTESQIDLVLLGYTRFVSTLNQQAVLEQLLPVVPPEENASPINYMYEPDESAVLAELLPRYVESRIYQALLESKASEQSARMVAMRNATDSANDLGRDLTLVLNKARQEAITNEIAEIAAGAAALS
ncbi:MAG: atpG [Chloroflexi bacterium]|nr:atpG [Chloroflexota bacterium]MDB5076743.1 atpG [Chloroflexota bacterium]